MSAQQQRQHPMCKECGFQHDPKQPHNVNAQFYQFTFEATYGRAPTWADAVAHCAPDVQQKWKAMLIQRSAWTEPDPNFKPPEVEMGEAEDTI